MHVAAEHGHESNVDVLVEAGANLTLRDHLGLTPLDLAEKVLTWLIVHDARICFISIQLDILGINFKSSLYF